MTEPNQTPADDQIISEEAASVPGFPKTLRPYRRKLVESAYKIGGVLRGQKNLNQAQQVAILKAVVGELRKMTAGAVKALEIAENRDYPAYLAAKEAVKKGKITAAEQAQFNALTQGLGIGEYDFDGLTDEIDEEAAELAANDTDSDDEPTDDEAPTV